MPRRLEDNLAAVRERIERALRSSGRPAGSVQLLAVTKSVAAEPAQRLCELGQLDLAESRVGQLEHKAAALARAGCHPRWHFIGHLQSNKVRRVVRQAAVLHSVDSAELLERVGRIAAQEGRRLDVYLQLGLTGEASKHGLPEAELGATAGLFSRWSALRWVGLMAMGPAHDPQLTGTRAVFERAAALARWIAARPELARLLPDGRPRLSLGMSSDLELAIAAGSDLVRVGTALFEDTTAVGAATAPAAGDEDGA